MVLPLAAVYGYAYRARQYVIAVPYVQFGMREQVFFFPCIEVGVELSEYFRCGYGTEGISFLRIVRHGFGSGRQACESHRHAQGDAHGYQYRFFDYRGHILLPFAEYRWFIYKYTTYIRFSQYGQEE